MSQNISTANMIEAKFLNNTGANGSLACNDQNQNKYI